MTSVLIEAHLVGPGTGPAVRAVAVTRLDAGLLDAVVRIVRLAGTPQEFRVLGPLVLREIAYRLAAGEEGDRLREIALVGGRAHRMAKAIELIHDAYEKPLRVESLARRLGMSVSSLQHQFKAVTAMSPVQFQKQLRMQEARRLLLAGECDVATAGYRVGYRDPSHFSRDYRKRFGEPPLRDVERLRYGAAKASRRTPRS